MTNPCVVEKRCPRCCETKLASGNFYKSGASRDGYSGYCINCTKVAATAWQRALPKDKRHAKNQRDAARQKEKRHTDPEYRQKRAAYMRSWAAIAYADPEHRARRSATSLIWKHRDPEKRRANNQIHNNHQRAKRLGIVSAFSYYDWVIVLGAFQRRCAFCGADAALLDIEHLDPLSMGGTNTVGNIVPACRPCNANKWRKSLDEFAKERGFDAVALRERARRCAESI